MPSNLTYFCNLVDDIHMVMLLVYYFILNSFPDWQTLRMDNNIDYHKCKVFKAWQIQNYGNNKM